MPLPFDELETVGTMSLVEKLEAYEPKEALMKSELMLRFILERTWVSACKRNMFFYQFGEVPPHDYIWQNWKKCASDAMGMSWPECAELIYGEMF